jgi:glycerol kinase
MTDVRYILAIDEGTTNAKALAMAEDGTIVARASRRVDVTFPRPGWVEQDADLLWRSAHDAARECVAKVGSQPTAIAVTNQRESVLVWERTSGRPLGPCITWQCRRTADICDRLRADRFDHVIAAKTGLALDPLFSATKARWLLGQIADGPARAANGDLCVGTVDSWIVWNLTGRQAHVCDATNASRTQLFNLALGAWDDELLEIFGVPRPSLPAIRPSSAVAGVTRQVDGIGDEVPIAALIGDSHAALFGHAAFRPGAVKATYGTGSSLMTPTPSLERAAGLSSTVAWSFGRLRAGGASASQGLLQYALEGNITDTGGAVDWAGRLLGGDPPDALVATLAAGVADSGGVYLVPAFAGLGAPHWDDRARGMLCGLTRGAGPAQIARAALESIAYQVRDVFDVMTHAIAAASPTLLADGGASRNDHLMQFQADVLDAPVLRSRSADLSAAGAAWLAGLATGVWRSLADLECLPRAVDRFEPRMSPSTRAQLLGGWRDAIARARTRSGR